MQRPVTACNYKHSVLRRQCSDTNRNIKIKVAWCTADTDSKV